MHLIKKIEITDFLHFNDLQRFILNANSKSTEQQLCKIAPFSAYFNTYRLNISLRVLMTMENITMRALSAYTIGIALN
jgi:hypothetical protein